MADPNGYYEMMKKENKITKSAEKKSVEEVLKTRVVDGQAELLVKRQGYTKKKKEKREQLNLSESSSCSSAGSDTTTDSEDQEQSQLNAKRYESVNAIQGKHVTFAKDISQSFTVQEQKLDKKISPRTESLRRRKSMHADRCAGGVADEAPATKKRRVSQELMPFLFDARPSEHTQFGLNRGLQLEKILSSFKIASEIFCVVKWKRLGTLDSVPARSLYDLFPQVLINYFQQLEHKC